MSALHVNLDLIRKYNVPGPRYTSYPPAVHFTEAVSLPALQEKIRANNRTPHETSLYFHLPFCWSLCWYCGCTNVITADQTASVRYLGYLEKELEMMGRFLHPDRPVVQMHLGGGSPSFLTPEDFRRLGRMIHARFKVAADAEAGVEIDPRRTTKEQFVALRDIGFNRASIGVQDNNPAVQKAVHRLQPFEQTAQVAGWLRELGFKSLNIDLIYGFPLQTPETFNQTLDEVLTLQPDRFAIFNYAHVPWMKPAQKIVERQGLPSAETKLQLLKLAIEKLTGAGYVYIGMDHFARDTDELAVAQRQKTMQRNFQGYSTRGGADIYAFGMSSLSQTDEIYWQNRKELPAYYAALDAGELPMFKGFILSDDDKIRRQTIMRLMCDLGLDYAAMSRLLGVPFEEYFKTELASMNDLEADGLLAKTASGLTVTDLGRLLIRNIAMRFDAYLGKQTEGRFSKTI